MMEKVVLFVVALGAAFAMGVWTGHGATGNADEKGEGDTVIVRDTVEVLRVDTLRITDTKVVRERVRDTLFLPADSTGAVPLFKVQREFAGDNYRAWVSGLRPFIGVDEEVGPWLDSLHIEKDIIETTITVHDKSKPKRWGLGVQAGVQYDWGNKKPAPYIGVGVSYSLFMW